MSEETDALALVNRLLFLLDDQISSAEKGYFEYVERVMEESSVLANEVAQLKAFEYPSCQGLKGSVIQKYKRLELMLGAAKEITKDELKLVQTTKKMLAVYRSSNR